MKVPVNYNKLSFFLLNIIKMIWRIGKCQPTPELDARFMICVLAYFA